mmetsp:Transcript_20666/g.51757  ORF Transcript_20666/g.51757 Transcript_20666/m.51757 type:complete len:360 (-) Transcript_20666:142-1221(-)
MATDRDERPARRARGAAAGEAAREELSEILKCAAEDEVGDYLMGAQHFAAANAAHLPEWHPVHAAAVTRGDGVDILFQVCECYKVGNETICSSVLLTDRFLARACGFNQDHPAFLDVARLARDAPLLSLACFLIMCKFRERVCPLLIDLELLCEGRWSAQDVSSAEDTVLLAVNWDLRCVTAVEIANKVMEGASAPLRAHITQQVECLVEVAYYSRQMLRFPASSVAVAAILHAAERLNVPDDGFDFIPGWVRSASDDEALAVLSTCFAAVHGETVGAPPGAEAAAPLHPGFPADAMSEVPSCPMDLDGSIAEEEHVSPTNVADAAPNLFDAESPIVKASASGAGGPVLGDGVPRDEGL